MTKSMTYLSNSYICEYCKLSFKKESTIQKHMCPKKKRFMLRNDKSVMFAFLIYQYWYKIAMGSKKDLDYDDFLVGKFYKVFFEFSQYIESSKIQDWEKYIFWLVANSIKINQWSKDSTYNRFILENIKNETPERAIEKFILYVKLWSEKTGYEWNEYFSKCNPEKIIDDVISGRISPWVLYCSNSAQNFIENLPDELIIKLSKHIDFEYWLNKVNKNKELCEWIQSLIP
jgi:hypothetical protein